MNLVGDISEIGTRVCTKKKKRSFDIFKYFEDESKKNKRIGHSHTPNHISATTLKLPIPAFSTSLYSRLRQNSEWSKNFRLHKNIWSKTLTTYGSKLEPLRHEGSFSTSSMQALASSMICLWVGGKYSRTDFLRNSAFFKKGPANSVLTSAGMKFAIECKYYIFLKLWQGTDVQSFLYIVCTHSSLFWTFLSQYPSLFSLSFFTFSFFFLFYQVLILHFVSPFFFFFLGRIFYSS